MIQGHVLCGKSFVDLAMTVTSPLYTGGGIFSLLRRTKPCYKPHVKRRLISTSRQSPSICPNAIVDLRRKTFFNVNNLSPPPL